MLCSTSLETDDLQYSITLLVQLTVSKFNTLYQLARTDGLPRMVRRNKTNHTQSALRSRLPIGKLYRASGSPAEAYGYNLGLVPGEKKNRQ
jgi:hypothetical protein